MWLDLVRLPRSNGNITGANPDGREVRDAGRVSRDVSCLGGWGEVGWAFSGAMPVDSLAAARVGLVSAMV